MNNKNDTIIFALLYMISTNEALRILVSFPLASESHGILGHGFVNHLLEGGHEVVHITSFPRYKPVANLTEVSLASMLKRAVTYNKQLKERLKLKNMIGKPNFADSLYFLYFSYDFHKQLLEEEGVVKLLSNPNEKFDLVVSEWFFSQFIAGIAPLLQCPLVWVGSTTAHWQALQMVDEIPNPAYSVDPFSVSTLPLSFFDRAYELWILLKKLLMIKLLVVPFEKIRYNTIFTELARRRGVTMPSYDQAVYNASFMFINSHPSIGIPYKLPANAAYIGGYHIDKNAKPLPENLQKLMDNAQHGVVYFSMGSGVRSADMSTKMKDSLLKMFSNFNQTVIWKFEEDFRKIPPNVHLLKWAPQQSILSHPNIKVFITHGGLLSTTEAIHYGVPVIGLPVMADQHVNMNTVSDRGFGVKVLLTENLAEHLLVALRNILSDTTYKTKAKELSAIYHERENTPGDVIRYWVQHVVKTRGAPHLQSPALHVPMYQKLYLDLLSVTILIIISMIYITKRLLRFRITIINKEKKS